MTPSQMSCEQVMQPGFMHAKLGSLTMTYITGVQNGGRLSGFWRIVLTKFPEIDYGNEWRK